MFSFLFLLVIFFSCIFWANNLIILCYSDWNEKKKERIKVLCRKRMKFKQLSMCCEAKLFRVLFFLFVRLFLTFFWSILIHGCRLATEKKDTTMYKRSDTNTTKQNNLGRSTRSQKNAETNRKRFFFSAKTADQYHRYLHLEPNFYDNLSRSLATNAILKGNT